MSPSYPKTRLLPEWNIQIPTGGVGLWKPYVKDGIPHLFQHPQLLRLRDLQSLQTPMSAPSVTEYY